MVPIISVPISNLTGRSFQECTAISALPSIRSSLISFVKTPMSGILLRGVSKSESPSVFLYICLILVSGET